MKTDVFHLKIVPISKVLPHEHFDDQRTFPLVRQLQKDRVLRNPIIVALIDDKFYIQLDGMNRLSAFKKMGFKSILVQIIDYNDQELVELASWVHFFQADLSDFLAYLGKIDKIEVKKGKITNVGHRYIKEKDYGRLCTLVARDKKVILLYTNGNLVEKIERLNKVTSFYEKQITRDVLPQNLGAMDIEEMFRTHNGVNFMTVFPTFTRHQIVKAVKKGQLFPPGVTRHVIQKRCLQVNAPLSLFNIQKTIRQQNKQLERLLSKRAFRHYEESIIYFE